MPYLFLRDAHSLLRWIVLMACLWALLRVWSGLLGRAEWTRKDQMAGLIFTSLLNVQFVLGLILYAISPIMRTAMANFATAMKDRYASILCGRASCRHAARYHHCTGGVFDFQASDDRSCEISARRDRLLASGPAHPCEHPLALHEIWSPAFPLLWQLSA